MSKPDFFLIGAPRCGTTAMCEHLRRHPQAFVPALKEPHFFALDFPSLREADNLRRYMQLFEAAGAEHFIVVDGSPLYLYSSLALAAIREFNPHARLLVMLRNPPDMLFSYHARRVATFSEPEPDFAKAWSRRNPAADPLNRLDRIARFGEQLERAFELFPREQVHVILFDDFLKAPQEAYRGVLQFAGLSGDDDTEFRPVNPTIRSFRAAWMMKRLRKPPSKIKNLERKTKMLLGIQRFGVIAAAEKALGRHGKRSTMPRSVRSEILDEYRDDIARLSRILDRDLRHWLGQQSEFAVDYRNAQGEPPNAPRR